MKTSILKKTTTASEDITPHIKVILNTSSGNGIKENKCPRIVKSG
jgi:hypothetical protein